MNYTFELLGIAPILYFFNQQQGCIETPTGSTSPGQYAGPWLPDSLFPELDPEFQPNRKPDLKPDLEYVGSYHCTLDATLAAIEPVATGRAWDWSNLAQVVVDFWLDNAESIRYWKSRLEDAGNDNLLLTRVASTDGLRREFEALLDR